MSASTCDGCGAHIVWAVHFKSGKRMPFNSVLDPSAKWILESGPRGTAARMETKDDPPGNRWMPHFATCPYAAAFRGRSKKP